MYPDNPDHHYQPFNGRRELITKMKTSGQNMKTRPSEMEVSPKTFGLSKSILPIDHRIARDHGIAGDHRMAGIIE